MTILVTGATGLLGSHVLDLLVERRERPRALVRPGESAEAILDKDVDVRFGDVADPDALKAAADGVDCVVHCAARTGPWGPQDDYRATNVEGLKTVVRTALSVGARRIVHVSSITVHGARPRGTIDERAPLVGEPNPYSRSKVAGEKWLRALIATESVPVTIVRPGWIYGPRDAASFGRFATLVRSGRMPIIGSGQNHLPLVYVRDVADGVLRAAQSAGTDGRAYLLVGDEPVTQRDYLEAIAAELAVAAPTRRVPLWVAWTLAAALEGRARLPRRNEPPPMTRYGVELLGREKRFTIDRARRELGFSPKVGLADGVRSSVDWYLSSGQAAKSEGTSWKS